MALVRISSSFAINRGWSCAKFLRYGIIHSALEINAAAKKLAPTTMPEFMIFFWNRFLKNAPLEKDSQRYSLKNRLVFSFSDHTKTSRETN